MHVMHVIDSLSPGGAERMLVDIANESSARHRVSVCVTRGGDGLLPDLAPAVRVHMLGRRQRFEPEAFRRFARIVKREGVDILHAHGRTTGSFLVCLKALGFIHEPVLLHDHFGAIEIDRSAPAWFRLLGRRFIARYVGVCDKLGQWAVEAGVPLERVEVIENAIDLDRVRRARPCSVRDEYAADGLPLGVLVAGIRPEKGVDVLLDALAGDRRARACRILVVGGARDRDYATQCQEKRRASGLEQTVVFLGERSDAAALIRSADFGVVAARSESGPLVLIEYLAAGIPVVSTRVGAVANRLADLGTPEFVPPDDAGALAAALGRLLESTPGQRKLRIEYGTAALDHFDIKRKIDLWENAYRRLKAA